MWPTVFSQVCHVCGIDIYTSSSAPVANLVVQVLRILRPNFNVLWPRIIWSFLAAIIVS